MAQTVCVIVSASDKKRLEAIVADRNRPQKHVARARGVLASAGGDPVQHVAALLDVSLPMVWRWQQRFAEKGADGLVPTANVIRMAGDRDSGDTAVE